MSDLLAINCDSLSSPSIKLKLLAEVHGNHALGWGFGWYPNDNQAAIVAKDPVARDTQVLTEALTDWSSFRSTMFICKIRGASKGYSHHEAQPFSRSFAGRDWLFMHNGDMDKMALEQLHHNKSRFLEPLGKTDSELAFCYLLGQMQACGARCLNDVAGEVLLGWFEQFDPLGCADMFITDGATIACYQGKTIAKPFYYARLQPPLNQVHFDSDVASLEMDDPRDNFRTALIFTSCPFGEGWTPMQPGQLIIAKRASIIWDSIATGALSQPAPPPPVQEMIMETSGQPQQEMPPVPSDRSHMSTLNVKSMTRTGAGQPLGFRLFDISHRTEYTYGAPVEHSTHTFRLLPTEDYTQEVVHASLTVSTEGEEIQYEDVFGNQSIHYSIHTPYDKLVIESKSRVKIYQRPPDDPTLSRRRSSLPMVWMPWQQQMMMAYLLPVELPETQLRELTDYAMSFVERNGFSLLETLKDINYTIFRDYTYVQGITSLNTTPFEVYASRQGVCQDFANLFICLARLLGLPARYRMGYIFTGEGYANKVQSEASHAWLEVYLPYVGWRGFDPTNGYMVEQDHIRVACGRNFRDSTPTEGTIYAGGGNENLFVTVRVTDVPPEEPAA